MAEVVAVNISERKGIRKHEVPYIELLPHHGIVGDAHAGDWHRQVSLLAEESINTILQMAELKKNGRLKALIVTGCLAQRYKQEIIDEIPEVDAILGTTSYEAVGAAIREVMDGETPEIFESIDAPVSTATERLITTAAAGATVPGGIAGARHAILSVLAQRGIIRER